jgi:hypothetical protein
MLYQALVETSPLWVFLVILLTAMIIKGEW